jgi:hypothetical protein
MWEALSRYQPYADQDGHGESWRVMCEERTQEAAWTASVAARGEASAMAAWAAATAPAAKAAESAAYWSACSIERIEAALKERQK